MCGITGIYSFSNQANSFHECVAQSIQKLILRGPDAQAIYSNNRIVLGHARLSILDTSAAGNQPFTDASGRYTIVYNGEFYNYQDYYAELKQDGIHFSSTSDTEVLLYLFIKYGKDCIEKINGFFAFAIFDHHTQSLFVARDRMGIKPLYIYTNDSFMCFCSEMSGIMQYPILRTLNHEALHTYLQLLYIPAPYTILNGIRKLLPGHYIQITPQGCEERAYYTLPYNKHGNSSISYDQAQSKLISLLDESVKLRLISDVPLGTFLSGGIDSSIITSLAKRHVQNLKTFSIGFTDNSYFDETYYADLVAKKLTTEHTVIPISNHEFSQHIHSVLEAIDEPFADSSAIAVYVLSKFVKPHVTVALSGDGADELFAGYNKHRAHLSLFQGGMLNLGIRALHPLIKQLPQSRNNALLNTFRKLNRYANAMQLSTAEAYWKWCSLLTEEQAIKFVQSTPNSAAYKKYKNYFLQHFSHDNSINDILYADQKLVLPNDMLTKVDRMSMANSLEVRTPFLDYNIISFANNLPPHYKIDKNLKKRILQDSFRSELPIELYNRPKQGFEVPLHAWCTTVLQVPIQTYLSKEYIERQEIFEYSAIHYLKQKLHSSNPGDSPAQIWSLLVFQYWWKKYMD